MKPHQKQMIDDGLPAAFIMTPQERKALWDKNPPKAAKPFTDPRLEQDRTLREQQKKEATAARIKALRKSKGLIDASEQTTSSTQPQENEMKYVIKPLDARGHPVMRAVTSINDDATEEQIDAKVLAAVERGGSKVVNVLLVNTLREVVLAWVVTDGVAGPCDAGPFQPTEAVVSEAASIETETKSNEEENDVTRRKVSAKKESKPKKIAGEVRKGSKTEIVANLLKRKSGCTANECLKAVGWNAISMPYMAKAA